MEVLLALVVLAFPLCAILALVLVLQSRSQIKAIYDQFSSIMIENSRLKEEIEKLAKSTKQDQETQTHLKGLAADLSLLTEEVIALKLQAKQETPNEEARVEEQAPTPVIVPEASEPSIEATPEEHPIEVAPEVMVPAMREPSPAAPQDVVRPAAVQSEAGPQTQSKEPAIFDWESLIGVKLFSWLAGIALAIAAVFLIRHSLDQDWFTPTVRIALGFITGTALLIGGERRIAREYAVTANALEGGGIAILYITIFGAAVWWSLFPILVGLGLACVVTALSVILAYRNGSLFIGILGLISGFAAPALFSTGQDNAVGLFAYLLLLDGAFWWLTYRKRWPGLLNASIVLTAVYQWGWLYKFFALEKLPIAVVAFLVFPVLGFVAFWVLTRKNAEQENKRFLWSACFNATLPLLFALFLISLVEVEPVEVFFYSFVGPLLLGYFVVRLLLQEERLHLLGSFASLFLLSAWSSYTDEDGGHHALYAGLVCSLFYLVAPIINRRLGRAATNESELATLPTPLFLFFFPSLLTKEATWIDLALFLGLGLVLCLVSSVTKRSILYVLSMLAAFLAILFWQDTLQAEAWPMTLMLSTAPFVIVGLIFVRPVPDKGSEKEEPWWGMKLEGFSSFAAAGALFLAQATALVASQHIKEEPLTIWLLWYLVLVLGFFWHSIKSGLSYLVILASLSSMGAIVAWPTPEEHFILALPLYSSFLLFPALLGKRSKDLLSLGFAAVLASALHLIFVDEYLQEEGSSESLALAFVGEAALLALLFFRLYLLEPFGQRRQPHLALLVASAILLITIAAPIKYSKEILSILWAAEAAALLLLYRKVWHRGLPALSALLFALVFAFLGLNPEVLLYYPRTESPLWNWFLYCYPIVAAAFFMGSRLCKVTPQTTPLEETTQPTEEGFLVALRHILLRGWQSDPWLRVADMAAPLFAGGVALLFILLNVEIADVYSEGPELQFRFLSDRVSEGLTYTLGWASFAIALLVVGIVLKQRATRLASIGLLLLTTLKCFLLDLGTLTGLHRVGAFVGLAFALAGVALLLQRFVLRKDS